MVTKAVFYDDELPPGSSYKKKTDTFLAHVSNDITTEGFLNSVMAIPGIKNFFNAKTIDSLAGAGGYRPYPMTCKKDYHAYGSLIDYNYYSRHLPPASEEYIDNLPSLKDLEKIFARQTDNAGNVKQIFCKKSSYMFPTYAQHLIDSFIQTKVDPNPKPEPKMVQEEDGETGVKFLWNQTTTPHNINLGPLYGEVDEETDQLRLKSGENGEKGRMKSQTINGEEWAPYLYDGCDKKKEFDKLPEPQGLSHIWKHSKKDEKDVKKHIFAFGGARTNLNPNISAWNTLLLREHNRIAGELEKENPQWDDNRVFEIARNVTMAQYLIQIVEEYIQHISGVRVFVNPADSLWHAKWYKRNWITAEFAVLYRWHSIIPEVIDWGGTTYSTEEEIFNNGVLFEENGLNGSLRDAIVSTCKHRATAMRPFNSEKWMVMRDKRAIEMSRDTRLQSYAEYSKYLGRGEIKSFKDISSDPKVQEVLKELYGTPDRVEFFVGLLCSDHGEGKIHSDVMTFFVGMDAFSQALAHPLLSENVWKEDVDGMFSWIPVIGKYFKKRVISEKTFGKYGAKLLGQKKFRVKDLLERNTNDGEELKEFVGMTVPDYKYETAVPKIVYYAIVVGAISAIVKFVK